MNLKPLIYWAKERESIRRKKEKGLPGPWTKDEILQQYRFCNVRRRDDAVSRWIIQNVLNDIPKNGALVYDWFMWAALSRWLNWPPTLKLIKEEFGPVPHLTDPKTRNAVAKLLNHHEGKVFTGAYMVVGPKKHLNMTKVDLVVKTITGAEFYENLPHIKEALLQGYCQIVRKVVTDQNYWGSFMAGQFVSDLTYTPMLADAEDLNYWAPMGPGSLRGMNRLLGNQLDARISPEDWTKNLAAFRKALVKAIPDLHDITAHDVQNCLCEVDKYLRVENREGRPRATYKSHSEHY